MASSNLYSYENKFELITNSGATITEIKEPVDWAGQETVLSRDPVWHGVNFEFTDAEIQLGFDCAAGKTILENLYNSKGNDSEAFLRFSSKVDGVWEAMPDFKLDFNFYNIDGVIIRLTLIRTSFEDLFRTRLSIKNDINSDTDLDGNSITPLSSIDLELHSKGLFLQTDRVFSDENPIVGNPPLKTSDLLELRYEDDPIKSNINGGAQIQHREQVFYAQPDFGGLIVDDIEENQNIPFGISLTGPNPQYILKSSGILTVDLSLVYNASLHVAGQWRGSRAGLRIDGCSRNAATMGYSKMNLIVQIGSEKIIVDTYEELNAGCDLRINQTGYYFQAQTDLVTFENVLRNDEIDPITTPGPDFYSSVNFDSTTLEGFEILANSVPVTIQHSTSSVIRNVNIGDEVAIYLEIYGEGDYVRHGVENSDIGWFVQSAFYNNDLELVPNISSLQMSLNSVEEFTNSQAYLAHETLDKLLEILTGNSSRLRSDLLGRISLGYAEDGCASKNTILNGFGIRNFDIDNKPPNTSIEDFLKSFKAIYNAGYGLAKDGFDDVLIFEKAEHFYQDLEIRTVEEPYNYLMSVDSENIYNEIEIGYEEFQEDGINLLDEPNTRRSYLSPIRSEKRKVEIISSYISSGYTIELQRRDQFSSTASESLDYDDKIFIVAVRLDGLDWKSEKDEDFLLVQNVFSPETAYNLKLTPKRMLYRWSKLLKSPLRYKNQVTDLIKFTSGFKNNDLRTQVSNSNTCEQLGPVGESEPTALNVFPDGDNGIFSPEIIEFNEKLSWVDFEKIRKALKGESTLGDNFGYIRVKDPNGIYEIGWVTELRYKISSQEAFYKLRRKWQ